MTWKSKLIREVGKDKAQEILSERAKEMRAKVKNPYQFTSAAAKEAANKRWHENKQSETQSQS